MAQAISASGVDFKAPHKKNLKTECAPYVTFIIDLIERKL